MSMAGFQCSFSYKPCGRPDLSPVLQHWRHGSFCLMVTKRLLSPRELKPPQPVGELGCCICAHTRLGSSRSGSGQTEPAAEGVSQPGTRSTLVSRRNHKSLPVQIKEQLYHGRTYWKVTRVTRKEKEFTPWSQSFVWVGSRFRLGKVSEDACLILAGSRALHSRHEALCYWFRAASFGCSSDPVPFTVRYIIHPTVSPPAQIYRLPVLSFSSCSSKSLVDKDCLLLSSSSTNSWHLDSVSPRSEDLQDKCLSTEGQMKEAWIKPYAYVSELNGLFQFVCINMCACVCMCSHVCLCVHMCVSEFDLSIRSSASFGPLWAGKIFR